MTEHYSLGEGVWNQQAKIKARRLSPRWRKSLRLKSCHLLNCVPQNICWSLNPQNLCDVIWKWSVCRYNQVRMRSFGCILILYDWCPYKKRKMLCEERDTWRSPGDHRGRCWNDTNASQGMPRVDGHHWKLGGGMEGSTQSLRGSMPPPASSKIWILGF